MGNLIKNKSKINSGRSVSNSTKTLMHKANVLSASDVEKNRSSAYSYLAL